MTLIISFKTRVLFVVCIILLLLGIYAEYRLVTWYEIFYNSIEKKNTDLFFKSVLLFLYISISINIISTLTAFLSELLDLNLKISLSSYCIGKKNTKAEKLNQKIIDDATFAAEKIAFLLPQFISNCIKSILMIFLLFFFSPDYINIISLNITFLQPMVLSAVFFTLVQIFISRKYFPLMAQVDNFKRKAENNFRIKIFREKVLILDNLTIANNKYLSSIEKARKYSALKSSMLSFLLGVVSTLSYIAPFVILFMAYANDQINFGQVMMLFGIFSSFQNSVTYLWSNSKDFASGIAAIKRIFK